MQFNFEELCLLRPVPTDNELEVMHEPTDKVGTTSSSPNNQAPTPNWDVEQLEVILEAPTSWQLVIAGPGAGKSAVACQRVAYLVDESVPPSRILLVSFTRAAVAELRDRIVSYAVAGVRARSVRISTIDSHAWSLRTGVDDEPLSTPFGDGAYELSIQRTIELFRNGNEELIDFMAGLEHLIIDEAQDVLGLRADLVMEMLKSLAETCGVTILADPAQAIYGFTTDGTDEGKSSPSLLDRISSESPRPLLKRALNNIHRVKDGALSDLFLRTRKVIEEANCAPGHLTCVQKTIRETCGNHVGVTSYESLADFLTGARDDSMLVLFRRRADVLVASSYCSRAGVEHRLRMSSIPTVVRPWLGWLLGETVQVILGREQFDHLWESRASLAPEPFVGEERDACWVLLHRLAAGKSRNTVDLVHLRNIVSRARPPIELCYPELGSTGPILGTIHASKGREADAVILVMPSHQDNADRQLEENSAAVFEEGRVYYVGATRARRLLSTAGSSTAQVGYLDSKRIYRRCGERRAQLEIGREGDVDGVAHLAWSSSLKTQLTLAAQVGRTVSVKARAIAEDGYALRIILEHKDTDGFTRPTEIGQLSSSFQRDLGKLWGLVDLEGKLRPADDIAYLYLVSVATVGLTEGERSAVKAPFNQSAFALAPVIKGFPMIYFLFRKRGRFSR